MPWWIIGNTSRGGKRKKIVHSNSIKEHIEIALTAIDSRLSLRNTARIHGIPRSTLSDRKYGAITRDAAHKKMQRLMLQITATVAR